MNMQTTVQRLVQAALVAVDPAQAVREAVQRQGSRLVLEGTSYDLDQYEHVYVVGGGKAGAPMAQALTEILGARLSAGWVNVKEGHLADASLPETLTIHEAGHPLPNAAGQAGALRILEMVQAAGPRDLVFCLISGGGSALLTAPARGVKLAEIQKLTADLLVCGASIDEINTLRKHLDLVKGGGLARLAAPARLATLILSDVVGGPLDVIAAGPTVPDPTTFQDAYQVLERYALSEHTPQAIVKRILRCLNLFLD